MCVPGVCGSTCKKKKWGVCILWIPKTSSCCYKVPDAVCETKNAACKTAREAAKGILKAAEKTVDSSKVTLDAAKGVLEGAKGLISALFIRQGTLS